MTDEWSDWFKAPGNDCPVPSGYHVQARAADGTVYEGQVRHERKSESDTTNIWDWHACNAEGYPEARIVEYRIRTPWALRQLREMVTHV